MIQNSLNSMNYSNTSCSKLKEIRKRNWLFFPSLWTQLNIWHVESIARTCWSSLQETAVNSTKQFAKTLMPTTKPNWTTITSFSPPTCWLKASIFIAPTSLWTMTPLGTPHVSCNELDESIELAHRQSTFTTTCFILPEKANCPQQNSNFPQHLWGRQSDLLPRRNRGAWPQ